MRAADTAERRGPNRSKLYQVRVLCAGNIIPRMGLFSKKVQISPPAQWFIDLMKSIIWGWDHILVGYWDPAEQLKPHDADDADGPP